MIVGVARSPLRLLAYALVAVPMVLLAVDMAVAYRYFPRPETTTVTRQVTEDDGTVREVQTQVYTEVGKSQRRRDLVFGIALGVGGSALLLSAFAGLVLPRRLLIADDDGLQVRVGSRGEPLLRLAWEDVAEMRSGVLTDDAGEVPVLSLRLRRPELIPERPLRAVADPPWLHLFAGEWDWPAHKVAALLEGRVTGFRGWEAYG